MDNRAVSETLGYILIFSIAIAAISTVAIAGVNSLEATRDQASAANARESMELVATAGAEVHRGRSPGRTIPLSTAGGTLRSGKTVTFDVKIQFTGPNSPIIKTYKTKPLIYEGNGATYIYVGGALLFAGDGGASMLRAPNGRFDTGSGPLILPLVTYTHAGSSAISGSSAIVEMYQTKNQVLYNGSVAKVTWTIKTQSTARAEAWARLDDACSVPASGTKKAKCIFFSGGGSGQAIVRRAELEITLSV